MRKNRRSQKAYKKNANKTEKKGKKSKEDLEEGRAKGEELEAVAFGVAVEVPQHVQPVRVD